MRIVLVNWARVSEGAQNGGGANLYAQQLGLELVKRGHEVFWLSSGLLYIPEPSTGEPGLCKVRRMKDFAGIRVFEVVNSPVVAPGPCQSHEPLVEVSAPLLEAEVGRFLGLVEPHVVHFQNIEGFSGGCVEVAKRGAGAWQGARVVYSLHNYHSVCPQVYLMQRGVSPCFSFDSGRACVGCLKGIVERTPGEERRHRASYLMPRVEERVAPAPFLERVKRVWSAPPASEPARAEWPGRGVEVFTDTLAEDGGGAGAVASEAVGGAEREIPKDVLTTPLVNDPAPDPVDGAPNEYGRRRLAMVEMLSGCDKVHAVSSFVHRKFEALGVRATALVTLPIGTRMVEVVTVNRALAQPAPFEGPSPRPIRMVFMGYNNYYKGLPMLLDAMDMLSAAQLARVQLAVYAKGVESIPGRLDALESRRVGLTVRAGHRYEDVPRLAANKDLGLVPSVWWDNGPQTVMEFFACGVPVLAAEVGGIPDMVRHGHNGLLHKGNDRAHLAAELGRVIERPQVLFELRRNVEPPQSMKAHAVVMEGLYNECLAGGGP